MLTTKVHAVLDAIRIASTNKTVCVSLSGGPDSTALLHIIKELSDDIGIKLLACHINHGLRGNESQEDEGFAIKLAEQLDIPIKVYRINVKKYRIVKKLSSQEAGRELRYLIYSKMFRQGLADFVALGHTSDDVCETVFMNFLRGAGAQGLSGIPPIREGKIVRPFIQISKNEILKYLNSRGIDFRTDSSNSKTEYLRNKVRIELLPYIQKEFNPSIAKGLERTARIMRDINEHLSNEAIKAFNEIGDDKVKGQAIIDVKKFKDLSIAIQREVLRLAFNSARENIAGISFERFEDIRELACGGKSGELDLPGAKAVLSGQKLLIKKSAFSKPENFNCKFEREGVTSISSPEVSFLSGKVGNEEVKFDKSCRTVFIDAESLPEDAAIRNRLSGDVFFPLGATGGKKLKKFFIDSGISKWERNSMPLLASGSQVLWIPGVRLSEKLKIKNDTKEILKVEMLY